MYNEKTDFDFSTICEGILKFSLHKLNESLRIYIKRHCSSIQTSKNHISILLSKNVKKEPFHKDSFFVFNRY